MHDQYQLTLYDSEEGPAKSWAPAIPNTLIFDEEFGGFMGLIENFLQAIRGLEAPLNTLHDALASVEVISAAYEAMWRDAWVPIDS